MLTLRSMAILLMLLTALGCSTQRSGEGDGTSGFHRHLIGLSEQDVRDELGEPIRIDRANSAIPHPASSEAEQQAFYDTTLDAIWHYSDKILHFSLSGKVIKVE